MKLAGLIIVIVLSTIVIGIYYPSSRNVVVVTQIITKTELQTINRETTLVQTAPPITTTMTKPVTTTITITHQPSTTTETKTPILTLTTTTISPQPASPIEEKISSLAAGDFYKNQITIREITAYNKEAIPYLIQALDSKNTNIRRYSAQAIGDLGIRDDQILAAVLKHLPIETERDAKANLIYILDVLNDQRALNALTSIMKNISESEDIRYRATYAVARFSSRESFEVLKELVNDQSIFIRKTVLWGLGLSKVSEAEKLLTPIFENKTNPIIIRYWAARGLTELGRTIDFKNFRHEFDQKLVFTKEGADYNLKTDLSNQALSDIEKTVRQIDNLHKAFFNATKKIKEAHTNLMLFKGESDFRDFTEIYYTSLYSSGGGYIPSDNILITYVRPDYERTLRLVKHEWTHRFIDLYLYSGYWKGNLTEFFIEFPVWFDEGFAEYAAYTNLEKNQSLVSEEHAADLVRRVNSGNLRKVRDLVKDKEPYRFGISYSEVWGLVYFLLNHNDGQYSPAIHNLVRAMKNGSTNINDVFLSSIADLDRLQVEWQDFIKRNWSRS